MHRKLPLFPPMTCVDGCTRCCGIVPCTEAEYRAVSHVMRAKGITPRAQGTKCPLAQDGRCTVYDARPAICRAFGHSAALLCPEGLNANGDERRVAAWVLRGGRPTRLLHETLVDAGIVADLTTYLDSALAAEVA